MDKLSAIVALLIALAVIASITTIALKGFPNEYPSIQTPKGAAPSTHLEEIHPDPYGTPLE